MKKHSLLIIIGSVLLVVGISLTFIKKKENNTNYVEQDITKEEAYALVLEKTKNVIELYEKVDSSFKVVNEKTPSEDEEEKEKKEEQESKEDNPYVKVSNYNDVVSALYTEKGIKELETIKFNKQLFVDKKDEDIYLLKEIPDENKYSNSTILIDDIKIKDNEEISAKVTFSSDGLDKEDNLTYYLYEKNIKLVKDNDRWLIDSFIYSNTKGV